MAIRIFNPILAGAKLQDRRVACIHAIIAIALTAGMPLLGDTIRST